MTIELQQIATLLERVDNLEAKIAFQDDLIEQLNNEITVHHELLTGVNEQLRLIGQRVKDMNTPEVGRVEDETPPPHY
ncbi:SlyX family protein [Thalassotalea psychrophila]|uniref:Protein SlyX homolog n=1 Tax=Thalassotalea psychrophila TaxID=3065647 RepID=A0ABY9TTN8_9GAMM|nr:SlyX family protein [Colwelliaceae bacterium SQ149]